MEILESRRHKGAPIIFVKLSHGIVEQFIRQGYVDYYHWPSCRKVRSGMDLSLEDAWSSYIVKLQYNPNTKRKYKSLVKGDPNTCVYCKTNASGPSAHCLNCGGGMHLACAESAEGVCPTKGCDPRTSNKSVLEMLADQVEEDEAAKSGTKSDSVWNLWGLLS